MFDPLNLYWSVGTPSTLSFLIGFPYCELSGNAALSTLSNCSLQLELLGSFQITPWLARFVPLLSNISSDVEALSILSNPLAGLLRFGL